MLSATEVSFSMHSPDQCRQNLVEQMDRCISSPGNHDSPFVAPMGMLPTVQRYCQLVQHNGWDSIRWKHNFTGLHMAAQLGSESAVHFLLHANAAVALNLRDKKHKMRPIDYAKQAGHLHLLKVLDPVRCRTAVTDSHDAGDEISSLSKSLHMEEELQHAEQKIQTLESSEVSLGNLVRQLEAAGASQRLAHSAELRRLDMATANSSNLVRPSCLEDATLALAATDLRLSQAESEVSALRERAALRDSEMNAFATQLADLRLQLLERDKQLREKTELLTSCQQLLAQREKDLAKKAKRRTVTWSEKKDSVRSEGNHDFQDKKYPLHSETKVEFEIDLTTMPDFAEKSRRSILSSSGKSEIWNGSDTDSDTNFFDLTAEL